MVKDRVTATSLWRVGRSAVTRNVERNGQRPNVFRKKRKQVPSCRFKRKDAADAAAAAAAG